MFHGCFKGVSRVFHGCFVVVSGLFQGCLMGVSRVFQRVHRGFQVCSNGLQEYFDNMSSIFHGCFIGVTRVFYRCRKDVAFLGVKSPLELACLSKWSTSLKKVITCFILPPLLF